MRKIWIGVVALVMVIMGCESKKENETSNLSDLESQTKESIQFDLHVEPQSFSVSLGVEDEIITVSQKQKEKEIDQLIEDEEEISWHFPNENLNVSIQKIDNYIDVAMTTLSQSDEQVTWPAISGESYYFPFGQGKLIPSDDDLWKSYLSEEVLEVIESLSMQFFAVSHGEYALVYIFENPYHTRLKFSKDALITFDVTHEFLEIDDNKEYNFRIYLTENNPVNVAKIYRDYVIEKGKFKTLAQKAENNPNIEKLYGAPHIYLWNDRALSINDIVWPEFLKMLNTPLGSWLSDKLLECEEVEEIKEVLYQLKNQDYVDRYQKNVLTSKLSVLLTQRDFYEESVLKKQNTVMKELLEKGIENLTDTEIILLNKQALVENFDNVFESVAQWNDEATTDLLKSIKNSGISSAWIGLDQWTQAYVKPELVDYAIQYGFLIGPYDSYHSIHEPGAEQWHTAAFKDSSLFEEATIMNRNDEKIAGFKQVGRKLNPTLTLPLVKERVDTILSNQIPFNSWFIDCDATGEIYDDYSPEHITTQEQDLQARLNRMAMIRDDYGLVIGSEGGNDFASTEIAFAHGIELQSFSWMDEDMSKNKESEYYIGKYYSNSGGVPEHFGKKIPVKETYKQLFLNPQYQIPLYKLVYHDSVITTYHWDWSTLKIQDEEENRMIYEMLYNVPPLYHLDRDVWEEFKETIVAHTKTWQSFSKDVITKEMTNYERLTDDGLVQLTQYGNQIKVVGNYRNEEFIFENQVIPAKSVLILDGKQVKIYTPEVK